MAKTLFILRHAKSSWAESNKSDKDRALKVKGISDIINTARSFAQKVNTLDLIVTSSANRAVHTAVLFAETIGFPPQKIRIEPMVYQADDQELVEMIKRFPNDCHGVMIVGHNPTLTYLANRFLADRIHEFPTSGLVGIVFNVDSWSEISPEKVKTVFRSFDL
ncbi:SixA phosphatase family protein [Tenuifilum thalassicum]|uniref:Histidine phosphatase family protein n=1 Tax=Tenuifilum thalassicum TaxID=2590900 RepID=A0A7D4CG22_9BACT|nr:histidine phosphatase family protein [Tenuifilum thalassicum]QKG79506.1 hypothetical protein FHG85_04225 [Tenuifilum thalassicum]